MDADDQERPRDRTTSRREKRWSMNSQRLEEIVAELMKPISDIRRSFDTDLSALLEEYLTEAGLHALEASEDDDSSSASSANGVAPNYAELALLLQHSASVYSRKVDFLYQHVLNVSDSLHNSTQEEAARAAAPVGAAGVAEEAARRRRRPSAGHFAPLALEPSAAARREPLAPRPPPTLPRMYIELEPRVMAVGDAPLLDYAGEPVGLPSDFHVTWRLQNGFLVGELEGPVPVLQVALNPISLVELQAALEAAAPPAPAALGDLPADLHADLPADLPAPDEPPLHASTPLPEPCNLIKSKRKRRSDVNINDIVVGKIKMLISPELSSKLNSVQEFSISKRWISQVVERRKSRILAERRRLRGHSPLPPQSDFRGFDHPNMDIGGFLGWTGTECTEAALASARALRDFDSDDDGFFEQSSLGDSDHSRVEELAAAAAAAAGVPYGAPYAAPCAGGGLEVRAVARGVLAACPAEGTTPFNAVLDATAKHQTDVSRILLATLFLANAGNVEIIPGAPLTTGTFSLRLLSTDERLYCAAERDHFQR